MSTRARWFAAGLGVVAMIAALTIGTAVLADRPDEATHPPYADGRATGLDTTPNCHARNDLSAGVSCGEVREGLALIDYVKANDQLNLENLYAGIWADYQASLVAQRTAYTSSGGGGGGCADGDWECVRQCESGGNYSTNTGNGYYGAYQFDQQTWEGVGGSGLPSDASPAEQDARAQALYEQRGSSPWPSCG